VLVIDETTTAALEERLNTASENNIVFQQPSFDLSNNATATDTQENVCLPVSFEAQSAAATTLDFHLAPSPPQQTGTDLPVTIKEEL
jgi:hypothetical protein